MACKNDFYAYKHDYSACWDGVSAYELEGMVREPGGTVYKPGVAVCWNGVSALKIRVTVYKPEGVVCKLGGMVNKPGGAAR